MYTVNDINIYSSEKLFEKLIISRSLYSWGGSGNPSSGSDSSHLPLGISCGFGEVSATFEETEFIKFEVSSTIGLQVFLFMFLIQSDDSAPSLSSQYCLNFLPNAEFMLSLCYRNKMS